MRIMKRVFVEKVPTVNPQELYLSLHNGNHPFVLDVRQPEEFRFAHIEGAVLIPLGELEDHIVEIPTDRDIVCICATGHRSVPAVRRLLATGYFASSLKNGMLAWQISRLPVKKGM